MYKNIYIYIYGCQTDFLIYSFPQLWRKFIELEEKSNPDRLKSNRGGTLLREEKERSRVKKVSLTFTVCVCVLLQVCNRS